MGFNADMDMNEALVKLNTRLQQISRYPETALEPTIYSGTDDSNEVATFNVIARPPDDGEIDEFLKGNGDLKNVVEDLKRLQPPTVRMERLIELAEQHPKLKELIPQDVDVIEQNAVCRRLHCRGNRSSARVLLGCGFGGASDKRCGSSLIQRNWRSWD